MWSQGINRVLIKFFFLIIILAPRLSNCSGKHGVLKCVFINNEHNMLLLIYNDHTCDHGCFRTELYCLHNIVHTFESMHTCKH